MPDIRSFFGPKGGGASAKQMPAPKEEAPKKSRAKARKVIEDSEDEDQPVAQPKKPVKPSPKTAKSANAIKGVETTASSYFASATAKPSAPEATPKTNKVQLNPTLEVRMSPRLKQAPATAAAKREPKKGGKKQAAVTYAKQEEDDDEDAYMDENGDAADDIHAASTNARNKRKNDDYAEDDSEEEFLPNPKRIASRGKAVAAKVEFESAGFEDHQLDDDGMDLDDEKPAKSKGKKGAASSKKRKSSTVTSDDDDDDDDEDAKPRKKKAPAKPRASKGKKAAGKPEPPPPDARVETIMANLPLINAPEPPPKDSGDEDKKFNFKAGMANQGPPPMQGQLDIPEGNDNCLMGLTFVFTGLLKTIGREEGQAMIKRYGGKVTTAPSSKTNFVVLGDDAGPSKLEKIKALGIKTIDEGGLFYLIKNMPVGGGTGKGAEDAQKKREAEQEKVEKAAAELEEQEKQRQAEEAKMAKKAAAIRGTAIPAPTQPLSQLWTAKYAPTQLSHICGNKSQVEKIQKWLREWPKNRKYGFNRRGADGMGAERAVIISGPPGVGKTTAAHLAAKLEGYDIIESNASDTRSKKLVEGGVSEIVNNTSLLGFFAGDGKKVDAAKKKIVLIMDEVDGMSAGDRGGVGALAKFCKKTEIPLILICNERRLPKMKPFDHAAFDVKFTRPTVEQVRSRIMTICRREGLNLLPPVIDSLIEGTRTDIRQIINMLSTFKLDQSSMDFDQSKAMSKAWEKHIILKPWDIVQKIISGGLFGPASKATLNDKIELYFNDHEFSYLMLQENYIKALPALLPARSSCSHKERNLKHLDLVDQAAESISDGDLVDRMIHGPQQHWTLMPTHAIMSTVRPASFIAGQLIGATFTSWLGNNSAYGRLNRCLREIQSHMRLRTSGDHNEIRQQYLPVLWDRLVMRLKTEGKDGIDDIIALMDSYYLTRDDWTSIRELGVGHQKDQKAEKKDEAPATKKWGQRDEPEEEPGVTIDSQVKAAFTRRYNSTSHSISFMKATNVTAPKRAAREKPDLEEAVDEDDDAEVLGAAEVDDDDDDLDKDKYIKKPKARKGAKKGAATKAGGGGDDDGDSKPAKGKGRGRPKKK